MSNLLRQLPQVQALLERPLIAALADKYSVEEVKEELRLSLQMLRTRILSGEIRELPDFSGPSFSAGLSAAITGSRQQNLRPVINATGIIIHTNLGRACLAPQAIAAMNAAAANYSNLELDLASGKRGSRHAHVETLICDLTGAEAAMVVNNCAAAVMLSLMTTARGRKVIASRGELIEIGGAFRLPDIIEQSGAVLKEVGATNRTRTSDYASAIDADTAVLLKSHTSNFRIVGFTEAPAREELAALAKDSGTILMEDLGSGVLIDLSPFGLKDEPVVGDILKAGVDLVMFSGDKLLGGPQCGIIAGRADIISQLKSHPLARGVRIDKLSVAALEATLRLYSAPHDPLKEIPVLRALSQPIATIKARAERLVAALAVRHDLKTAMASSASYVGGGSLPQQDLASYSVSIAHRKIKADGIAATLRAAPVPIIGRIKDDRFHMDARTLTDEDVSVIAETLNTL